MIFTLFNKNSKLRKAISKYDRLIKAVICFVLGILLIMFPQKVMNIFCYIFAGLFFASAAVHFVLYFKNNKDNPVFSFELPKAFLCFLAGMMAVLLTPLLSRCIPVIFGIFLVVNGFIYVRNSVILEAAGKRGFAAALVFGLILISAGIACMVLSGIIMSFALKFTGVCLIISAIIDVIKMILARKDNSGGKPPKHDEDNSPLPDGEVIVESVETSKEQ